MLFILIKMRKLKFARLLVVFIFVISASTKAFSAESAKKGANTISLKDALNSLGAGIEKRRTEKRARGLVKAASKNGKRKVKIILVSPNPLESQYINIYENHKNPDYIIVDICSGGNLESDYCDSLTKHKKGILKSRMRAEVSYMRTMASFHKVRLVGDIILLAGSMSLFGRIFKTFKAAPEVAKQVKAKFFSKKGFVQRSNRLRSKKGLKELFSLSPANKAMLKIFALFSVINFAYDDILDNTVGKNKPEFIANLNRLIELPTREDIQNLVLQIPLPQEVSFRDFTNILTDRLTELSGSCPKDLFPNQSCPANDHWSRLDFVNEVPQHLFYYYP